MGGLAAMMDGILAAVSQRAFWSETRILDLVRNRDDRIVNALYGHADEGRSLGPPRDLRAMRIFASEQQQTWLVVDNRMAYCVLDDRRREEPRVQWGTKVENALPVRADENWSAGAGALRFGTRTKQWLYSKDLFKSESVSDAINRFLSRPEN